MFLPTSCCFGSASCWRGLCASAGLPRTLLTTPTCTAISPTTGDERNKRNERNERFRRAVIFVGSCQSLHRSSVWHSRIPRAVDDLFAQGRAQVKVRDSV